MDDLAVLPTLVLNGNVDELLCLQPELRAMKQTLFGRAPGDVVQGFKGSPLIDRSDEGEMTKLVEGQSRRVESRQQERGNRK